MKTKSTLIVTGASGQLGRRVVELLAESGAGRVVAVTRTPEKLADLAPKGVTARPGDFDNPAGLKAAFAGGERLLLISTDAVDRPGRRVEQHARAIEAAKQAGIAHVVYTSIAHADTSTLRVAQDHLATERALRASGLGFTFLRNNLYMESALLMLLGLPQAIATGTLAAATGNGAAAFITRENCARAAAAALAGATEASRALEITGPAAVTAADVARLAGAVTGKPVRFVNIAPEELKAGLLKANLPEPVADLVVDFQRGIATGQLGPASGDFMALTGHGAISVEDYLRANRELLLRGT